MNMKSVLLGSATALIAVAGAQAADLPSTKAAPAQYVRICDVYGAGFFYIPGTDTCLKVGGRVRFEMAAQTLKNAVRTRSAGGGTGQFLSKNGMDSFGWNSRGYLMMDARTQTAWGTVQTVINMRINSASGVLANNYAAGTVVAGSSFSPTLENAYIRFAGFTFGRAYSVVTAIPPYMWNADRVGGFGAGVKQLAYTATFGGGFSATIGIEDKHDSSTQVTANALGSPNGCVVFDPLCVPVAATATATGPSRLPNLVGNIRIDQAWGWAQLSGAVGQNTANFATPAALAVVNANGPLVKKTGWAIMGAARINLPMLAAGDHLHLSAGYSNGLVNYVTSEANGGVGKAGPWTGGLLRNDRNLTIFECGPGNAFVACSENTKAWHILAMFTHYWTPTVRQNFSASYEEFQPGKVTRNTDWTQGGLSRAKGLTLSTNVIWSPARGFDIGLELTYARLQQRLTGLDGLPPSATDAAGIPLVVPVGASWKPNSNVFGARMRVERTF